MGILQERILEWIAMPSSRGDLSAPASLISATVAKLTPGKMFP